MAQVGRRHPLLLYRALMNRWWPATLSIAIGLAALAWAVKRDSPLEPWRWNGLLVLAGMMLALTGLLLILRSMAYVQAFPTYIKLKTPFLRINISYKRVRRYVSTEFRMLLPPTKLRGWRRDLIAPLSSKTALVLELTSWPIHPRFMRLFLSPFFFKDKTPHFVILVDNWMGLSAEIDSKRTGPKDDTPSQLRQMDRSILGKLPRRDQ